MSTALFVGKEQGGAVAPSCSPFLEQMRALEARDAEKYSPTAVINAADNIGYTPEIIDAIERKAKLQS